MKRLTSVLATVFLIGFFINCGGSGPAAEQQKSNKKAGQQTDQKPDAGKEKKDDKAADTEAVPVQVVNPNLGDISSFILFSSNIDSEQVVDIYPMTSGIIQKINYDEGDFVNKGAVLAVLDDREASINEQKAKINYEQLKMEFGRQKEIYEKQMVSKEEYDKFKFSLETARLNWEQNKLFLSYTRITSPIAGVITRRYIKNGNRINTTQLSFSVVHTQEKIAVVNIPEQEKDFVFKKQKCLISAGNDQIPGYVKRISPAIDPDSGTFRVTVSVNDDKNRFEVGQFVNVKIIKKVHEKVVLLTKDALLYEGGKVFVFVVDKNNKALKKLIQLGFEEGNIVEVSKGLAVKEKVVTAGKSSLKNDTLVKVVEPIT
jgi:membrane fusion protein (multidrug efflux system)